MRSIMIDSEWVIALSRRSLTKHTHTYTPRFCFGVLTICDLPGDDLQGPEGQDPADQNLPIRERLRKMCHGIGVTLCAILKGEIMPKMH